jgi:hypothetical protein
LTDAIIVRAWEDEYEEFLQLSRYGLPYRKRDDLLRKDLPVEEIPDEFVTWLELYFPQQDAYV